MKRIVLLTLLLATMVPAFARDIVISAWIDLADKVLRPDDCIIKKDFDDIEPEFKAPAKLQPSETVDLARFNNRKLEALTEDARVIKPSVEVDLSRCKESSTEQYPRATTERSANHSSIADQNDKVYCGKFGKNNCQHEEPRRDLNPYIYSVSSDSAIENGQRYYIEEDSWWKARVKKREARRIVLVPAEQRGACWRSVLVIQPRIFNDGYKWIGTNFTYEAVEEYRFSSPLKIAGLLGLGASLLAIIKTIAAV